MPINRERDFEKGQIFSYFVDNSGTATPIELIREGKL
jgi:hypothetical protein